MMGLVQSKLVYVTQTSAMMMKTIWKMKSFLGMMNQTKEQFHLPPGTKEQQPGEQLQEEQQQGEQLQVIVKI